MTTVKKVEKAQNLILKEMKLTEKSMDPQTHCTMFCELVNFNSLLKRPEHKFFNSWLGTSDFFEYSPVEYLKDMFLNELDIIISSKTASQVVNILLKENQ